MSVDGRGELARAIVTHDHLRPLFKMLRSKETPLDIERALWLITESMRKRNYRDAMDVYMRLAIGNAPWPVGVTMVGIHARSARERIYSQAQAHVLHDERTRKYLQAVKRLISYAQRAYASMPSQSFEFNAGHNGWDKNSLLAEEKESLGRSIAEVRANVERHDSYGNRIDGSKASDGDTKNWKRMLAEAYGDDLEKPQPGRITVLALDDTMYSNASGRKQGKGMAANPGTQGAQPGVPLWSGPDVTIQRVAKKQVPDVLLDGGTTGKERHYERIVTQMKTGPKHRPRE